MKVNYSLIISDEANLDILEAFLWYDSLRKGLGNDFELCLEAEINRIIRNPFLFQKQYKKVRIVFIERFPYGIHYIIEKNFIHVIAVFHTSHDPQDWEGRL